MSVGVSVFVLALRDGLAPRLTKLRALGPRSIEVAKAGDVVWVRTDGPPDDAARILRLIPSAELFECLEPDRLRRLGRRVPERRLPPLIWSPLDKSLELRLPRAKLGESIEGAVSLRLVPRGTVLEGETLLLARLEELSAFAERAPAHRLAPLSYVVNERAEALVRGEPLPPLSGERYVLRHGVASPFGLTFSPPLAPSVIREWLGLSEGDDRIALFRRDGSLAEISRGAFAPLTRPSLRS